MRALLMSVMVAAASGGMALGQSPATKPAEPGKPAENQTPASAPQGAPAGGAPVTGAAPVYPPTPPKELYAKNDVRGKKAPKLEVEEWLSAKPEMEGKTILVDFWATWCGPCRQVIPEMEAWQTKFKDDLVVVGITNETKRTVDNFYDLRGEAIKYPVARDGHNRAYNELGITGIPHVLVISSDGIVRYQGFPIAKDDPLTEEKLKQIIDADKAARAKKKAEEKKEPAKEEGKKAEDAKKEGAGKK